VSQYFLSEERIEREKQKKEEDEKEQQKQQEKKAQEMTQNGDSMKTESSGVADGMDINTLSHNSENL
jgi:hypothetical protein